MATRSDYFPRHRFPISVIAYAVWLYFRFPVSVRDVETLLFERGLVVSYETVRQWAQKFGDHFGQQLRARERCPGRTWHLDEMAIKIAGKQHWLWRAVDETGLELDLLVQEHRDTEAAKKFFQRVLDEVGELPETVVTDGLRSCGAALRELPDFGGVEHVQVKSEDRKNNRVEQAHQPSRLREKRMQGFRSRQHAQRFCSILGHFRNFFALKRHHLPAAEYRERLTERLLVWQAITTVS